MHKRILFEYHSQEANIVSKSQFFSKLDDNIDFKNIDVSSLKESPAFKTIADVSTPIITKLEAQISVSKKETAPVYSTQKTLSNDEYFDMLVGAVSTKKDNANCFSNKVKRAKCYQAPNLHHRLRPKVCRAL